MRKALIVGVAGQDGTLLSQLLKKQGVEYLGLDRRGVVNPDGAHIRAGSITDPQFVENLVQTFSPDHIYYLAAHHHSSQDLALNGVNLWRESLEVQVMGLVNFLEAIRLHRKETRLFYASSAHIFGATSESPQTETTPRMPENIYAITKVTGMEACRHYREEHGIFASTGILYNHESAYRKGSFLSQKIIQGVMAIKRGDSRELVVGNLASKVDWGYAPDYVDAMVRILELPHPGDYIVSTGETHSVREMVQLAFEEQGLDYQKWVRENPTIIRASRKGGGGGSCLVGDSSKLRRETSWRPSVTFSEMVARLAAETHSLHRSPQ